MAEREALTAEYVRQILDYNPETGVLTWRMRPREHFKDMRRCNAWNARFAGQRAGWSLRKYWRITINYRQHQLHRLAWIWVTGEWPPNEIDHIDGDPSNNRWRNLRLATHAENLRNKGAQSNNTSGHKGVSWNRRDKRWEVKICVRGKSRFIGYFGEDRLNEAASAYERAARELHGEFSRIV